MAQGSQLRNIAVVGDGCTGCGACAAVCPTSCIRMQPDGVGFLYPQVDQVSCVGCGACVRTCPALSPGQASAPLAVHWAIARDQDLLVASSSGGVFGTLARQTLAEGGLVVGAALEDACRQVRHRIASTQEELAPLLTSKYVQSSIGAQTYAGVAKALRGGTPVLFSGTACQVAGLRGYLGQGHVSMDGLLCVDVVCHGVPAPRLWQGYLAEVQERAGRPVDSVNFRSKVTGWQSYSLRLRSQGEVVLEERAGANWYMRAFLSNAALRASCLACPVKRSCGSDLTLGDFWGIQASHPEVPTDAGVSCVLVNTQRGREALARVGAALRVGEATYQEVVEGNTAVERSVVPYRRRGVFMNQLSRGVPLATLMRRWDFGPSPLRRAWRAVRAAVLKARHK